MIIINYYTITLVKLFGIKGEGGEIGGFIICTYVSYCNEPCLLSTIYLSIRKEQNRIGKEIKCLLRGITNK